MNLYGYVRNNPVNDTDPFGLQAAQAIAVGIRACLANPACRRALEALIVATGLAATQPVEPPGDVCSVDPGRIDRCNAAFRRCYNRNPNNREWTNKCARALAECLSHDLPVIFPDGTYVK